jgi:hypothetical protein
VNDLEFLLFWHEVKLIFDAARIEYNIKRLLGVEKKNESGEKKDGQGNRETNAR